MIKAVTYCITLAALAMATGAQGQLTEEKGEFWFLGGVANSHIYSDSLRSLPMNSFVMGIASRIELKAPFYLGLSTNYIQRGFESLEQNAQLKNNYLEIGASPQAEVLPGLFVGPRFTYSSLISSALATQSVFTNYEKRTDLNTGFRSEWNAGATARIELQEGLEFGMNLSLPKFNYHSLYSEFYVAINPQDNRGESMAHRDRREAYRHIMAMRESVLFVRLHTLEHSIEALRRMGRNLEADETEFKIKFQNERIIRAFNEHFTFCPVYYFYSHDSRAIHSGDFQGVLLDGVDLPTQTEIPDSTNYYIADFGVLEPDTATFFQGYAWVSNGNFSRERVRLVYRPTTFRFGALKVKDSEFNQLRSPFPFWVKTYGAYLFKRDINAIIIRFNEKLYDFHNDAKSDYRIKKH